MTVRTRFAPSPTGFMHIGNLRTALYAYLFAKHNEGEFILRIEDTDQERYVEGAVDVIYNTMRVAGLNHDEGPDRDGGVGPYIQSERKELYKKYAEELVRLGGAYYCFCSKERLETLTDANNNRKYDKHCFNLSKEDIAMRLQRGDSYVIRQNIPEDGVSEYEDMVYGNISVECKDLEDNILLKSDGMPTYNFANVVDDHLMNINYVIRGTEYLSSTPKYNLVYKSFGWQEPHYMHLPPIMKDATRKLSKRYGDANFEDFIKKGYLVDAIINYIALLGWSPKDNTEKMTIKELIANFNVDGISKSSSIFDESKMRWLNAQYIRELDIDTFNKIAKPYIDSSKAKDKYDYSKLGAMLHSRVEIFSDIPDMINFLEEYAEFDLNLFCNQKMKTSTENASELLTHCKDILANITDYNELFNQFGEACATRGLKKGALLWVLRIAITGKAVTPGGATEMVDLLGYDVTIGRINFAIEQLQKK